MHMASNTLMQQSFSPQRMNFRKVARLRAAEGLAPRKRGGQPGNRNRLIHGRYSRAILERKAWANAILRRSRYLIALMKLETKWRRFQRSQNTNVRHLPLVGLGSGSVPTVSSSGRGGGLTRSHTRIYPSLP